jgi:hypothetical protein
LNGRPLSIRLVACTVFALVAAATLAAPAARAALGDCGQPLTTGTMPMASDCSAVLRAAVGLRACENCVCDVNSSQSVSALDALLCLKFAVGQNISLDCPSCDNVTTTTREEPPTTSTSTSSTTTTIPIRCDTNGDCGSLPEGFRCNPNTETCEKPCTKNADCHDFYECNLTTHYCQEPASLQF